jgi:hypothetical protein
MPLSLSALTTNADAVERLQWTCDLDIEAHPGGPAWFSVDGVKDFQRFGRESTGSEFVLLPGSPQRVLYVSSEGAAGILAADFEEFIKLIVACPYWRDILKFSGSGKLEEMRRAAVALEATYDGDDEVDEARRFFTSQFGLAEPDDPVGALHRAVSNSHVVVRPPDGQPCMSLFNSFTVDDTPFLRGIVD